MDAEIEQEASCKDQRTYRKQVEPKPFQAVHSEPFQDDLPRQQIPGKCEEREPAEQRIEGDQRTHTDQPEYDDQNKEAHRHQRCGPSFVVLIHCGLCMSTAGVRSFAATVGGTFSH